MTNSPQKKFYSRFLDPQILFQVQKYNCFAFSESFLQTEKCYDAFS